MKKKSRTYHLTLLGILLDVHDELLFALFKSDSFSVQFSDSSLNCSLMLSKLLYCIVVCVNQVVIQGSVTIEGRQRRIAKTQEIRPCPSTLRLLVELELVIRDAFVHKDEAYHLE